jgi:hypothetical protein
MKISSARAIHHGGSLYEAHLCRLRFARAVHATLIGPGMRSTQSQPFFRFSFRSADSLNADSVLAPTGHDGDAWHAMPSRHGLLGPHQGQLLLARHDLRVLAFLRDVQRDVLPAM